MARSARKYTGDGRAPQPAHPGPAARPGWTAQPPLTLVNTCPGAAGGGPPMGAMRPVAGHSQAGLLPLTGSRSPAAHGTVGPMIPSGRAGRILIGAARTGLAAALG